VTSESTTEPPERVIAPAVAAKHPPPWLFGITGTPYGVVGSFAGQVMPYMTDRAHVPVESIGWYGTLLLVPPMLQFLYAPIVDVGPSRRHWLIMVALIGAVCLVAACAMPIPEHTYLFLAFAVAAQLISGLVGSCNGGLLAAGMPDHLRGRASAWLNTGNLTGGALSAAIALLLTYLEVSPIIMGLVLAAMMVLPSFAALWIIEPPAEHARKLDEVFGTMIHDVGTVVSSKSGLTGMLLCLSPVGTAALGNYFTALVKDFHAPGWVVPAFIPLGGLLAAVGAFVGGYLCDRYNRRALYLMSGALTAIVGVGMLIGPRVAATYVIGVSVYNLVTGFCYSAFTATVLETIGKGGRNASTQYALFVAAGNAAIAYVGLVDTRFHEAHGVFGVIGSDALLNLAGVAVLGFVFWRLGSFGRTKHVEAA
jgi:MFS family permease